MEESVVIDLKETVARMEKRLNQSQNPQILNLMKNYYELKVRFISDFPTESEHLLCAGGALMLIQEVDKVT